MRGTGRRQLRDWTRFEPWVVRIALNNARALLRDRYRRAAFERSLGTGVQRDADVALRQLVQILPQSEREVIVLHYGYGYPFREVARLLRVLPVTVRARAWRARRRLRREIRDEVSK